MSQVEELESSIDIVELVKRYTNIKKAWANYKALCPFPGHNEKTPSFIISPSKQIAHCFWCRRWWWPLKFIMDVENVEFKDALEILSNITWVKLKWYDEKKETLKKNIYSIFKDITNFYKNSLNENPNILKYLFDRWITKESIEQFSFWYASSWLELYNYLKNKNYDDNLIEQTNVLQNLSSKKDKFIGRFIIPIKNLRWDIVWFAWRIIDVWEPKYLNSPASLIYDKSSILYWLFEARNEITKKDFIIITEWYLDTISLHQVWFKNTVCVSWVALTEKHINIIKKLTKKIYLCFDNDDAWKNATFLAIEMLKNKDLEVKIISLNWWKDPDEIIKSWIDFNIFIKNSLSPIWFFLNNIENSNSLQDKKDTLKKLLDIIKNYQDNIERDYYLKEISKKLDISLDIVYLEFNKTRLQKREDNFEINNKKILKSSDLIIGQIIKYENLFEDIKNEIILKEYLDPDLQDILNNWIKTLDNFEINKKNYYLMLSQNDESLEIQAQIEWIIIKNDETILKQIKKTIKKLNKDTLEQAKNILIEKINLWDKDALKKYQEIISIKK